jgi:glyoxalase family protein
MSNHIVAKEIIMRTPLAGLHHVTAIASDPQRNLDFYIQVLGLRFVKRTVNFDDPGTYHFYFGDDAGTPGTILTFFPWADARRGHAGAGEVTHTAFSVPSESLDFWRQHLAASGVLVEDTGRRLEEEVLTLQDPDGMKIEIVGHADAGQVLAPRYAAIPSRHAIRGFHGVTLLELDEKATAETLATMGFREAAREGRRIRYMAEGDAVARRVDVVVDPGASYGHPGAGTVHHVAFRVQDDRAQLDWREELSKVLRVTPVQDRSYFHSIYFREPGGVLFEVATDPPGFGIDEPAESLGEALCLPPWLEKRRTEIEKRLPRLTLHKAESRGV